MKFIDKLGDLFKGAAKPPVLVAPVTQALPRAQMNYEDEHVPSGAQSRIRRILACLHDIETTLSREQVPGFTRIDVEQMREQHLPALVKSYINIPPEHRAEIFRKTGKSASFILNESLDQMQAKIDEILRNLAQNDIDAFTNNTRFIGQRYADDDNPFR